MSSNALAREPAWRDLEPGLPQWSLAEPAESIRLLDAAGLEGRVSVLSFDGVPQRMFRVDSAVNPPIFLKQIPPERRAAAIRAEAIGQWLVNQGIHAAAALAGFPKPLADGSLLVAMPYLEGRRLAATLGDCAALGKSVAAFHTALARHPAREQWRAYTGSRLAELTSIRADCAFGHLAVGPEPDFLRILASDGAVDFTGPGVDARPLHGDLNPGNTLFVEGRPLLLDFEDVFHSVLPVRFELAKTIERFVLVRVDDETAVNLGRALLQSYAASIDERPQDVKTDPVDIFRALALRSLCVLALAASKGISISDGEWRKFSLLERQARERAQTIRAIFKDTTL